MTIYLLRLGELTLKGGNRREFEEVLKRNLAARLRGTRAKINTSAGRFYVSCDEDKENTVENILDHLLGISGWAKTRKTGKTIDEVFHACIEEAKSLARNGIRTFKIEARRTDKSFPLDSYGIRRDAGEAVLNTVPELKVDVQNPQAVINVEIRERAYIYSMSKKGQRGLPVGTAGRGLLLLSGGIDSPVAGYMMAGRGMHVDAVYFHAYPYTSDEARQKVVDLAGIVGLYSMGVRLYVIGFTKLQVRIKEHGQRFCSAWR